MDLIFENKDRNIKIYKFLNIIDKNSSIGNILLNGLLHWNSINDQEILNIKNIITNKNVKGYTTKDTIFWISNICLLSNSNLFIIYKTVIFYYIIFIIKNGW